MFLSENMGNFYMKSFLCTDVLYMRLRSGTLRFLMDEITFYSFFFHSY